MDFIERLFGISPDGGDGSLEALYLVAFVGVMAAIVFRWRLASWRARARPSREVREWRRP